MYRIHPAENGQQDYLSIQINGEKDDDINRPSPSVVLTVWKRSSMTFQGTDGFTVFDSHGRLAFRVDNYTRNSPCSGAGGLVLMDGAGKALLSLKPQILSMQLQWNGYRGGEDGKSRSRLFAMRRPLSLIHNSQYEAEIFMGGPKERHPTPDFRIEGSFARRNCKIIKTTPSPTSCGQLVVAKISRKKVNKTVMLDDDVFTLLVQPGFDVHLIMAFVLILDRICRKPFAPVLCS